MNLPEIRIKSSFLLNDKVIPLLLPELKGSGRESESTEEYLFNKVSEYNKAWEEHGEAILHAMCEVLEVKFNQNIIDAYVLPINNSFSDPMIISTKYSSERFVDVFTHELTHRLLTDNNKLTGTRDRKLSSYWKDLFGDEHSFKTLVHIPIHAMLEHIFLNILQDPSKLQKDQELCKRFPDYELAWNYVEKHGSERILAQLKEQYAGF